MELNKYLRIKKAYIRIEPDTSALYDPANATVSNLLPTDAHPSRSNISPAAIQATVSNAADDPRTKELFKHNKGVLSIFKETRPGVHGSHQRHGSSTVEDCIWIAPKASIPMLLHEIGHGTYLYPDEKGYKPLAYNTMAEKYVEEARANRFAFDRLNSITDPKLKNELSSLAYRDLKPYELEYKLQQVPELIGKVGARGSAALGLGALGAGIGWKGGKWLADALKWNQNSRGAKALKWVGMLGLGALGGYGGYRLGKRYENNPWNPLNKNNISDVILSLPYYSNKLNRIANVRRKAINEYNENRDRLEDEFTDYQSKKDNYNYNIYNDDKRRSKLYQLSMANKLNYDDMTKVLSYDGYGYGTKREPTYDEMSAAFSSSNGTNLQ